MTCLCWDQVFCLTSVTEEPRQRTRDYVLLEPIDLNSVAQTPTAVLKSGKSAGFRTSLRTKSSSPSDSAHLHLNSNQCKNKI